MKKIILALLPVLAMWGCNSSVLQIPATGKPYEVVVVASKDVWKSAAGDTLRYFFEQDVEMLNQSEPLYDLLNVTPETVTQPTERHRNMIYLSISPNHPVSSLTATFDANAKEQLVLRLVSPSVDSLAAYIGENQKTMIAIFDKAERDRMIEKGKAYRDETIGQKIEDKFGFRMNIPKGYKVRDNQDDFLWISYELPLSSLGVVIYTFPAVENMTGVEIVEQRNHAVGKIPGPAKGSFMDTELMYFPKSTSVLINGVRWAETRGFWRVEGDFMGGPFVNYTCWDEAAGCMLGIDLYVSAPDPKNGKRNYIRQLESLVLSVELPKKSTL